MDSSWAADHLILKLSIVVLFIADFTACQVIAESSTSSSAQEYKPVGPTEYRVLQAQGNGAAVADDARRRLAPFQLCLLCKCCIASDSASAASTCTTMPCCFGIDCQLPKKPFGVCAFVPKICNCNSCAG